MQLLTPSTLDNSIQLANLSTINEEIIRKQILKFLHAKCFLNIPSKNGELFFNLVFDYRVEFKEKELFINIIFSSGMAMDTAIKDGQRLTNVVYGGESVLRGELTLKTPLNEPLKFTLVKSTLTISDRYTNVFDKSHLIQKITDFFILILDKIIKSVDKITSKFNSNFFSSASTKPEPEPDHLKIVDSSQYLVY